MVLLPRLMRLACAVLTGLLGVGAHAQGDADPALGRLAADIDQRIRAFAPDFGGAVVVEIDGRTIIRRGYGMADRERRVPFTTRTVAQIGSITKTFTGVAISRLIAERRIDPQARLRRYFPDMPEPGASLRINDILTHQAGLMDLCGEGDFSPLSRAALLRECMARPLAHPQGEKHYSNMGYSVMTALVETVSGQSWQDYLSHHVWRPAGLRRIGFTFDATGPEYAFANGYLGGQRHDPISRRIAPLAGNDWNLRGNGGIQASAEDMLRFLRHLVAGHDVLSDTARQIMLSPHTAEHDGVREGYGLFFRYRDGQLFRVGHSGSDGVFFSYAAWYPASNTVFYFVGNNGEPAVTPVLGRVLGALEPYLATRR